jgi:hypothetical protein
VWTTPTCHSSPLRHWARRRSTLAPATGLRWRKRRAPHLLPLDAVVILITLGDLSLLVMHHAHSPPPLHDRLVPVKDRLLWERRLGRHKVRALQMQKQGARESAIIGGPQEDQPQIKEAKINEELVGGNNNLPISRSPGWGASGAVMSAAMYKSTSRSPVPHDAGFRSAMGRPAQSQSPSRGLIRPSSRGDGAAVSRAARLLGRDTAQ